MSEYQYYEFCSLQVPLTTEAREELHSLSSRAKVTSHGASYVYNYGDFRGDKKALLLKYFDIFFYISNWGTVRLMFKYTTQQANYDELKKYCIKDVISCEKQQRYIILSIDIHNEEGFGWTEGEGILPELLPLYEEIKAKNYQLLRLISTIHHELIGEKDNTNTPIADIKLSAAQKKFLQITGLNYLLTSLA